MYRKNAAFVSRVLRDVRPIIPDAYTQLRTPRSATTVLPIEDPCSKLQGISDRKEVYDFQIRSLTPQQAAGNALAFSVQRSQHVPHVPPGAGTRWLHSFRTILP
jgi:hypothetical protein